MNILELLTQELKDKNWSTEEKCRYLYLRSCELFSYDERFYFYNLLPDGKERIQDTKNRKIDLENLEDNRVICNSHSTEVLPKILKELLNIDATVEGNPHMWNTFYDGSYYIEADATDHSDLTRVKMGLSTYGYNPTVKNIDFKYLLKETDQKIGYIHREYPDYFFKARAEMLFPKFMQDSSSDVTNDSDDFILYQLNTVKELFGNYNFSNFSDSEFCINYLIKNILKDNVGRVSKPIKLFQITDNNYWELVNLYNVSLERGNTYFILENSANGFQFYETTSENAKYYRKHFQGDNR